MTLHPSDWHAIPADTAELGCKLLGEDNPYRLGGDRLGDLLSDKDFADLYTSIGGPAISPVMLSLVSVFHRLEDLSDRLVAEILPRTNLIGLIKPPPQGPFFPLEAFQIDLEGQQAYCPGGQVSQQAW